jgi:hypothetical protein
MGLLQLGSSASAVAGSAIFFCRSHKICDHVRARQIEGSLVLNAGRVELHRLLEFLFSLGQPVGCEILRPAFK